MIAEANNIQKNSSKSDIFFFLVTFFSLINFWPITTEAHTQLQGFTTRAFYVLSGIFFGIYILNNFYSKKRFFNYAIVASSLLIIIFSYGLMHSSFNSTLYYFDDIKNLPAYLFLSVSLVFAFFAYMNFTEDDQILVLRITQGYFILSFLIILFLNGYSFGSTTINFEWDRVSYLTYSQGFTKFFGIASLASFVLFNKARGNEKIVSLIFTLFFFYLNILGGARGEFLFLLFVFGLFFIEKNTTSLIIGLIIFIGVLMILRNFILYSEEDLSLVLRLNSLFLGNIGDRDVFILLAFDLLYNNSNCLVFGCGFNYFQDYYSLRFGLYPHNSLLEMMISFGVISIFIIALFIRGLVGYLDNQPNSFLGYLCTYLFLISLKSDTIIFPATMTIILTFTILGFVGQKFLKR